mgnify:CR=1 FL=1
MVKISQSVKVGIAGLDIVEHPGTITTIGLGSCVGVVLYDQQTRLAGLVHVMLPHSDISKSSEFKLGKYADTGIDAVLELMKSRGANMHRIKAKIAGGAQMFSRQGSGDTLRIGPRNVEAVKEELARRNIAVVAEDTGGNKGRTIEFDTETFLLKVRTVQLGERMI